MHRPVASPGAGWRPSDVLCHRSGPAPPGGTRGAGMGVPGRIGGDPGVDAARHLQRSGRVRAVEESGRVDRLSRLGQGVAAVPPGIKHTFWGGTVTATKASNFGNRATAILLAGTMLSAVPLAAHAQTAQQTPPAAATDAAPARSEEHTSELQSLMPNSYAV